VGGVVIIELVDEDRAALRAVYLFFVEAFRLESVKELRAAMSTQTMISLGLGLIILDRLTESDEEETS
jgi:hypothetical protein